MKKWWGRFVVKTFGKRIHVLVAEGLFPTFFHVYKGGLYSDDGDLLLEKSPYR